MFQENRVPGAIGSFRGMICGKMANKCLKL